MAHKKNLSTNITHKKWVYVLERKFFQPFKGFLGKESRVLSSPKGGGRSYKHSLVSPPSKKNQIFSLL